MLDLLIFPGRTARARGQGATFPPLQAGYSDVAIMAKRLQIIVVVPTPEPVTFTIPGQDMIDLNSAPWRAHPATLAGVLVTASDQFSCGCPIVLVTVPAATSVAAPSPTPLGKRIAATPAMPLSRRNQRAIWRHVGSGIHHISRASLPRPSVLSSGQAHILGSNKAIICLDLGNVVRDDRVRGLLCSDCIFFNLLHRLTATLRLVLCQPNCLGNQSPPS